MGQQKEKRRTPRAPVSIRIDYSTVDHLFWDFASNINEGGLFVESNNPLDVGTTVQLKFFLPDLESPIETLGEVVWVGSNAFDSDQEGGSPDSIGMGIQFKEIGEESKQAINLLIKELRKK
jgi:type IV pilus assembly protein PilZ